MVKKLLREEKNQSKCIPTTVSTSQTILNLLIKYISCHILRFARLYKTTKNKNVLEFIEKLQAVRENILSFKA